MIDSCVPTLAITSDQIVMLVIAVFVILGGIFGEANKNKGNKTKSESAPDEGGATVDLEEIARRRRQQLEALAKQRRKPGGQGTAAPDRPAMASTARTETRQASAQERMEARRQKRAVADRERERESTRVRGEKDRAREDMAAAGQRERADTQKRQTQRDDEQAQRTKHTQNERQARPPRPPQRTAKRATIQRQGLPSSEPEVHLEELGMGVASRHLGHDDLGSGVTQVDPMHTDVYADGDEAHRHVMDVAAEPIVAGKSLLTRTGLKSWKHAIMMKEILDRPISMREDGTTIDPLRL